MLKKMPKIYYCDWSYKQPVASAYWMPLDPDSILAVASQTSLFLKQASIFFIERTIINYTCMSQHILWNFKQLYDVNDI